MPPRATHAPVVDATRAAERIAAITAQIEQADAHANRLRMDRGRAVASLHARGVTLRVLAEAAGITEWALRKEMHRALS